MTINILVLYYSKYGNCEKMAQLVSRGVESIKDVNAICRTVPPIRPINDTTTQKVPSQGAPYVTLQDLENADGLCLGCPTHFGNMPAAMKSFWDQTTGIWLSGKLINKPAGLFTSAGSLHGGHESTLLSMMLPLMHHGMIIAGVPYDVDSLQKTQTGGTPYGASHLAGHKSDNAISIDEKNICIALGKRIAHLATSLSS